MYHKNLIKYAILITASLSFGCREESIGKIEYSLNFDNLEICSLLIDLYGTDYTGECINCEFEFGVKGGLSELSQDAECGENVKYNIRDLTMFCGSFSEFGNCSDESTFWVLAHTSKIDLPYCNLSNWDKSIYHCPYYSVTEEYTYYTNAFIVGYYNADALCYYSYSEDCGYPAVEEWMAISSDQNPQGTFNAQSSTISWSWQSASAYGEPGENVSVRITGSANVPK